MATLQALRIKAKKAKIPAAEIRQAKSAQELEELIANYNGAPAKAVARKAVKKSVAKASTAKAVRKPAKSAAKKAPAAKSTTGKAKRPSNSNGDAGRILIGAVDFTLEGEWAPRLGSAPDRIIKTLKKTRGNRTKAFEILKPDIWDFMGKVKRNGEKRTKSEAEAMLKYRIARTLWDYCIKTNQHDKATNRIEYGTGPNAKPKRGRPVRKATQTAPKRRGRPPGTANKAKAPAKRGRPAGSKNKR